MGGFIPYLWVGVGFSFFFNGDIFVLRPRLQFSSASLITARNWAITVFSNCSQKGSKGSAGCSSCPKGQLETM